MYVACPSESADSVATFRLPLEIVSGITSNFILANHWIRFVPWSVPVPDPFTTELIYMLAGPDRRARSVCNVEEGLDADSDQGSELNFDKMLLETRVNGKVVQSQNTNELIFDIPTLIETCSAGITLQPGDVIATGTPEGVGARTQTFLGKDDVVEIAISGLGRLSNPIGDPAKPPPSCTPLWSSDPSPAPR